MGFPDGSPLAGAVKADAMAAKPEINVAAVRCMLVAQLTIGLNDWAREVSRRSRLELYSGGKRENEGL